jgi:hypothetical protein
VAISRVSCPFFLGVVGHTPLPWSLYDFLLKTLVLFLINKKKKMLLLSDDFFEQYFSNIFVIE